MVERRLWRTRAQSAKRPLSLISRKVVGGSRALRNSKSTTVSLASLDRKSTRLNSSHLVISYAVFFWKKKAIVARKVATSLVPQGAGLYIDRADTSPYPLFF